MSEGIVVAGGAPSLWLSPGSWPLLWS